MQQMLLHVERYGRKRTRIVALAEDLGMSHANVYRHFRNKSEIMDAVVLDWLTAADQVIKAAAAAGSSAEDKCRRVVLSLHRFLREKLDAEPGAIEIFAHAFVDHPAAVAAHLTGLRMTIAIHLAELSGTDPEPLALRLDLLATVLEPFLNPVLLHQRAADNDEAQLTVLLGALFHDWRRD